MQQKPSQTEDYSIEDLDRLIESIRRKTGLLNEEEIAKAVNYNEGYISQCRSRGKVSIKFVQALQGLLKTGLQNANLAEPPSDYSKQSLNNLTESNKVLAEANRTLAEANKTLAEANHVISKNHDELIQLTKMIVANSTVSTKNLQGEVGPEQNTGKPGYGRVIPSGSELKSGKSSGKH